MEGLAEKTLEDHLGELSKAFRGMLTWKWDGRFDAVLAEFGAGQKDEIRAILERFLPMSWDSSNIGEAPDIVRTVSGYLGGLWPGQQLVTSDPKGDAIIFCAWWPWGNGKTISIRMAAFHPKLSGPEKDEKIHRLKVWFGL